MNDSKKTVAQEMDLRDLIRVFWRKKVFLIIIAAAALILGLVISLVILPRQYVATASVTISPQPIVPAALVEKVTISDPFSIVKSPTKAEYLNRMKSQEVLQEVIDSLSLNTTTDALRGAITLTDVPASELINITVVYSDPATAKQIASTLSTVYKDYISEVRIGQLAKAKDFADTQIANVQSSYDEKLENLELLSDAHDIEAVSADIKRISEYLNGSETKRLTLETSMNADLAFIQWIETSYTFTDGLSAEDFQMFLEMPNKPDIERTQIDLKVSEDSLSQTLILYRYVSAKMNLVSAATEKIVLDARISELEEELDMLEAEYKQYSSEYEMLNREILRDKSVLLAYDQRKTEIETLISGDTSSAIVNVSSEATASSQPVSPSLLKNGLIALAAGIALGVAIVYFKDFWWTRTVESQSVAK